MQLLKNAPLRVLHRSPRGATLNEKLRHSYLFFYFRKIVLPFCPGTPQK